MTHILAQKNIEGKTKLLLSSPGEGLNPKDEKTFSLCVESPSSLPWHIRMGRLEPVPYEEDYMFPIYLRKKVWKPNPKIRFHPLCLDMALLRRRTDKMLYTHYGVGHKPT